MSQAGAVGASGWAALYAALNRAELSIRCLRRNIRRPDPVTKFTAVSALRACRIRALGLASANPTWGERLNPAVELATLCDILTNGYQLTDAALDAAQDWADQIAINAEMSRTWPSQ